MKKTFLIRVSLLLTVFLSSTILAADRVVVVPLYGGTETDPNLLADNIKCGTTILGVTGTYAGISSVCSADGRIWMDRNLGASQVATSSTDAAAYGDLYQWGRLADGHQVRTSPITATLSDTDIPVDSSFITTSTTPWDWRVPQNNGLWQGVSGTNNPCPSSFRLPTETEWETERLSWSSNDAAGAFASPLKLTKVGSRSRVNGSLSDVGSNALYWNSSVNTVHAGFLFFHNSFAQVIANANHRAAGGGVRCIMD